MKSKHPVTTLKNFVEIHSQNQSTGCADRGRLGFFTKKQTVYKRVFTGFSYNRRATKIIKLTLPAYALVRMPFEERKSYNKCRAEVLLSHGTGRSSHDGNYKYKENHYQYPTFNFDRSTAECASGIHFFFTRKEAKKYII